MSTAPSKTTQPSRPGPPGLTAAPPSGSALLLEKLNLRRSTPDSEAFASSDDEGDVNRHEQQSAAPVQKPVMRRPSWLQENTQNSAQVRKSSFASNAMSPTISHQSPSASDLAQASWGSGPSTTTGRPHAGSLSSPWGAGIWNNDQKAAPTRLTEIMHSPTSVGSELNSTHSRLTRRDSGPNSQIPFSIPLQPTLKTYRSQSYSVGQMDADAPTPKPSLPTSSTFSVRKGVPHSGLQHRPSRPSMLSEMSSDLGRLKEVDDDEVDPLEQQSDNRARRASEAKTIELLTQENNRLRQQQYHLGMGRGIRAQTSFGTMNGHSFRDPVPEEGSEYAVDEPDDPNDGTKMFGQPVRRMSEMGAFGSGAQRNYLENRNIESVKWQSSMGFGLGNGNESRRHSFADAPTRQPSIGSIGEQAARRASLSRTNQEASDLGAFAEDAMLPNAGALSYSLAASAQPGYPPTYSPSVYAPTFTSPYGLPNSFGARPPSPHRHPYPMAQPRHSQKLYLVLFKFSRADVFYVQEGTGLSVKPGDLVIVEADRGTDLGTVAEDNVDWAQAKELREHYAAEHYKWLMMYSQNAGGNQDGAGAGMMAASNGLQGSAVGGMGPPNHQMMPDPNAGELKPKLIKRVAQPHEVGALRDKEANEAKAKRVCMQKVKEHQLNMEILDAEFQFDWKKLTFFYFADSYINFNSLVTDLFKIYKTRIWMSAINPASFASTALGLQAPSGIGPGAVGVSRNMSSAERRQPTQQEPAQSQQVAQQPTYSSPPPVNRPYQGGFTTSPVADRTGMPPPGMPFAQPAFQYGYGGYPTPRPDMGAYGAQGMMQPVDAFPMAFTPPDYNMRRAFPGPGTGGLVGSEQPVSPMTAQGDWMNQFQAMSLNSR